MNAFHITYLGPAAADFFKYVPVIDNQVSVSMFQKKRTRKELVEELFDKLSLALEMLEDYDPFDEEFYVELKHYTIEFVRILSSADKEQINTERGDNDGVQVWFCLWWGTR